MQKSKWSIHNPFLLYHQVFGATLLLQLIQIPFQNLTFTFKALFLLLHNTYNEYYINLV